MNESKMMRRGSVRRAALALTGMTAALAGFFGASGTAHGDGVDAEKQARSERCAIRLSSAILAQSATPELMSSPDPQAQVDAMLASPAFIEHFASSLNATLNRSPAPPETPGADAAYYLAKHVLENGKRWSDVFAGPYRVDPDGKVQADPNGLGYFRSTVWMERNSGAETTGLRLTSAARILKQVVGLELVATTNEPEATEAERSAEGRKRAACAGCHYDNWFALDKLAAVLSRRRGGAGTPMTFFDPPEGYAPQQVLEATITNDKDIITKLVASENFSFNVCRTAFRFLLGRDENTCDGTVFDQCVDAFKAKGTMQAAVATIAKDASFCE